MCGKYLGLHMMLINFVDTRVIVSVGFSGLQSITGCNFNGLAIYSRKRKAYFEVSDKFRTAYVHMETMHHSHKDLTNMF